MTDYLPRCSGCVFYQSSTTPTGESEMPEQCQQTFRYISPCPYYINRTSLEQEPAKITMLRDIKDTLEDKISAIDND